MAVSLCQIHKTYQRCRFAWRYRTPVSAPCEIRKNFFQARTARFRIANENPFSAFLFDGRGERPDEDEGVEELVLLVVIEVRCSKGLHKVVIRETGAKHM